MAITASKLRQDVYRILDEVLATGEPVEIRRKGQTLRIVAESVPARSRLAAMEPWPDLITGDPDDLVHLDWTDEWRP